jgi:hypothetical protein
MGVEMLSIPTLCRCGVLSTLAMRVRKAHSMPSEARIEARQSN